MIKTFFERTTAALQAFNDAYPSEASDAVMVIFADGTVEIERRVYDSIEVQTRPNRPWSYSGEPIHTTDGSEQLEAWLKMPAAERKRIYELMLMEGDDGRRQ